VREPGNGGPWEWGTFRVADWNRFYGSKDPTNSVIALKDNGQSTTSRANPTSLSSPKGKGSKGKKVKKNLLIYI